MIFWVFIISSSSSVYAGWVDDWFDNAVYRGPSHFDGQQRGYYSLGSLNARLHSDSVRPVTFSRPKMSVGCGGINGHLGGMSFVDEDYLVQKIESLIQAAPVIAFDLALRQFSEQMASAVGGWTKVIDQLNGIQLNQCGMYNRVVSIAEGDDPSFKKVLQGLRTEIGAEQLTRTGVSRMFQEAKDDMEANNNELPAGSTLADATEGCAEQLNELFATGSLLDNLLTDTDLEESIAVIRAYVGDVWINRSDSGAVRGIPITGCGTVVDDAADDMLVGLVMEKDFPDDPTEAKCTAHESPGVYEEVEEQINGLLTHIRESTLLDQDDIDFVNRLKIPVYSYLRSALQSQREEEVTDTLITLSSNQIAFQLFDDLYRLTGKHLNASQSLIYSQESSVTDRCQPELYAEPVAAFKRLVKSAKAKRGALRDHYIQETQLLRALLDVERHHRRIDTDHQQERGSLIIGGRRE